MPYNQYPVANTCDVRVQFVIHLHGYHSELEKIDKTRKFVGLFSAYNFVGQPRV